MELKIKQNQWTDKTYRYKKHTGSCEREVKYGEKRNSWIKLKDSSCKKKKVIQGYEITM